MGCRLKALATTQGSFSVYDALLDPSQHIQSSKCGAADAAGHAVTHDRWEVCAAGHAVTNGCKGVLLQAMQS